MPIKLFSETIKWETSGNLKMSPDKLPDSGEMGGRIEASPEGGFIFFHGAPGNVGGVAWEKDDFLILPVFHQETHCVYLHLHFWEQGPFTEAAPHASIAMNVFPGFTVQVVFPLTRLDLETLFLPRTPGRLKNVSLGTPVDLAKVICLGIEIPESAGPQTIWLGQPRLADKEPVYTVPNRPVVDELGQWTGKEWRGKTLDETELVTNLRDWAKGSLAAPVIDQAYATQLSDYGGWKEKSYPATGFFRTEHDSKRWWLIDPAGHPFFSAGPDCVVPHMPGPVKHLESLFKWIPARDGEFADAWLQSERGDAEVSFSGANLIRAFGRNWQGEWARLTANWLKSWGFNTIANWSVPQLGRHLKIPYVYQLRSFPATRTKIFRDFPDVFSPEYRSAAAEYAQQLKEISNDPYLIGYFLRNEPEWGFGDYNIAEFLLAHPQPLACKEELIRFLANKYNGDATLLANAWRYPLTDFTDLHKPISDAPNLSAVAEADLREFTKVLIAEYIRVPAAAARQADPNHLNLGMRWAWVTSEQFYAGSQYCDVFSLNCYKLAPNPDDIKAASKASGLPVMIGEFHAGALDAGLPSTGLRGMADQTERGKFYRWYIEHAAAIPELVGAHYFQWGDQPVLGRFDGENCNIGLVDVCHRPYAEMIREIVKTHERMYQICMGLIEPTDELPKEVPREGF